jgi:hypothetical protein
LEAYEQITPRSEVGFNRTSYQQALGFRAAAMGKKPSPGLKFFDQQIR